MNSNFFDIYKPNNIDDINLTQHSIEIINIYLKNNKLLFLIYGPPLCGKTTLIDILLNNYYKTNDYNNNIIYINLLKEQGINYFKNELKTFCQIHNSKKNNLKNTIIIDDFDYLNEINQKIIINYIVKYDNINFILSCSDLHKISINNLHILELIEIQKTNNIFIEKIFNKLNNKLNNIIDEKIKNNFILYSNNSIPKLVNKLLEFNILNNNKDKKIDINDFFNNNIVTNINNYLNLCKSKKNYDAYNLILNLYNDGLSVIDILDNIVYYIKNYNDFLVENEKFEIIKIVTKYINIFNNLHEDKIELFFLTYNIINIFE